MEEKKTSEKQNSQKNTQFKDFPEICKPQISSDGLLRCIATHIQTHTRACVHIQTHTHTHTHVHKHTHTYTQNPCSIHKRTDNNEEKLHRRTHIHIHTN